MSGSERREGADAADAPWTSARLEARLGAFGARLALQRPPLCPELELWLMSGDVDLEAGCEELALGEAPPYWAFCWGSGQALARYLLDHPEQVRGRRVVDLGTGSGVAAIAAARAGAASVVAVDIDPTARRAAELNAAHNGVAIETSADVPESFDLLLAADVLYETGLRGFVFEVARRRGPCLLADPRRTGTPPVDFPLIASFEACTLPDVDSPRRSVYLHALPRLEAERLR
ncbi:MAG: 50S ribosomal protein L11 methyltransferase [Myxococcota bacterium]